MSASEKEIQELFSQLVSTDDLFQRENIYIELLKREDEAIIKGFIELLYHDDPSLRNLAIEALVQLDAKAFPEVSKLLSSEDEDIRIFAANILGEMKDPRGIAAIRDHLLSETNVNVVAWIVEYLGEYGNDEDISLLESIREKFKQPFMEFAVNRAIQSLKSGGNE
ncbi:HEAT repeat domain-containing protein [Carboxydothermus hydrogenoformans]|uniref:HEAT repeat domain-containing protein n=1 Tax=Carboxydothermus hydrogenoformans TaxID=129958 RepID=UPI0002EF7C84|nr:HEAT repeat domain-containing protein [Carboxydothermus hydrogenoformans]